MMNTKTRRRTALWSGMLVLSAVWASTAQPGPEIQPISFDQEIRVPESLKEASARIKNMGPADSRYCDFHPVECANPNNPRSPRYCDFHPAQCANPNNPNSPRYCDFHPAECARRRWPREPVRSQAAIAVVGECLISEREIMLNGFLAG